MQATTTSSGTFTGTPSKQVIVKPPSGWVGVAGVLIVGGLAIAGLIYSARQIEGRAGDHPVEVVMIVASLLVLAVCVLFATGLRALPPNTAMVMLLFGKYKGTVREAGFYQTNPLYIKQRISLRIRNEVTQTVKVNEQRGSPIEIAAVLVWRVVDTYAASFEVDNYTNFVRVQSESAVRHLASSYPYDSTGETGLSLRGSTDEVSKTLAAELQQRLALAGIIVDEARLSHLAYAPEIAGAMLRRQQAEAVVAARTRIVEGAVGMVEMALEHLSRNRQITLDEERKAAMVSNLMVVLCGDQSVQPVVNTGTLHH